MDFEKERREAKVRADKEIAAMIKRIKEDKGKGIEPSPEYKPKPKPEGMVVEKITLPPIDNRKPRTPKFVIGVAIGTGAVYLASFFDNADFNLNPNIEFAIPYKTRGDAEPVAERLSAATGIEFEVARH